MSGHAAVDGDHLACDVARLVRRQKDDEIGDVFGFTDIGGKRRPSEPGQHPVSQVSADRVGDDEAGNDGVDAVLPVFRRKPLRTS